MSEIDQVIEQKVRELRGLGAPTLQRFYWAITSVVGAIAVFGFLLPYIEILRFEFLQLILISFSIALIIAVISFRPRTREVNWSRMHDYWIKARAELEEANYRLLYLFERSSPSKKNDETILLAFKGIKLLILLVRMFYRIALIEGKSDLANDFQKELDELGGWLKTLERFMTPPK